MMAKDYDGRGEKWQWNDGGDYDDYDGDVFY